jgi:shikimate dehydrogenase
MIYEPPAIYGIIGNPVAHSLSPVMQNAAFKALDVNAVYKFSR